MKFPPALLLPLPFLVTACERATPPPSKAAPPPHVSVVRPARGSISRSYVLPGKLRAWQETTLLSRISGYVADLPVDRGSRVAKGDLVARLDAPELFAEMARARAELDAAEVDHRRIAGAIARSADLVAPVDADAARARAEVARAVLKRCETVSSFTEIVAPFGGVVSRRRLDPGAFVEADETPIAEVVDAVVVRVVIDVPQSETAFLKEGLPAAVTVAELPGERFEGTVSRMASVFDEATKTMPVEIDLPNPSGRLRPGMFASVRLELETREGALLLPAEALVLEKRTPVVYVHREGKAARVPIRTGFDDGIRVEVVEGLSTGDEVIVSGKQTLSDGAAVRVAP